MTLLSAVLAGGLGAVARYGVSGVVQRRTSSGFPLGTLVVNLTGTVALGILVGAGADGAIPAGFLGGYTTFSTWMLESVAAPSPRGATNLAITLAGGVLGAYLGLLLGAKL
jgi:fluoride exporter